MRALLLLVVLISAAAVCEAFALKTLPASKAQLSLRNMHMSDQNTPPTTRLGKVWKRVPGNVAMQRLAEQLRRRQLEKAAETTLGDLKNTDFDQLDQLDELLSASTASNTPIKQTPPVDATPRPLEQPPRQQLSSPRPEVDDDPPSAPRRTALSIAMWPVEALVKRLAAQATSLELEARESYERADAAEAAQVEAERIAAAATAAAAATTRSLENAVALKEAAVAESEGSVKSLQEALQQVRAAADAAAADSAAARQQLERQLEAAAEQMEQEYTDKLTALQEQLQFAQAAAATEKTTALARSNEVQSLQSQVTTVEQRYAAQ
eukprot:1604-Heterococcus_DN1.PRE.2